MRSWIPTRVLAELQRDWRGTGLLLSVLAVVIAPFSASAVVSKTPESPGGARNSDQPEAATATAQLGGLYIKEFRVVGAHHLRPIEVEKAVYPFMGPRRGPEDVEHARAALEKTFQDKGFQTVSVQVPSQNPAIGIVVLRVVEAPVGRLRVRNSRYFSLPKIKEGAPSLAEGNVPDFGQVTKDIVALNQMPDRRVTPALKAGVVPGTVDIDLNVEDTLPLHGSLELNNRYSADTTPLRLNASASYNNLWQLDHSIGGSVQISPENLDDVKVYSGYYVARFPEASWLALIAQGVVQESNVSTLGSTAVAGRGNVEGGRAIITLPAQTDFYHSITFGFDRKHFNQDVTIAGVTLPTPITYYPFSANYSATWAPKGSITNANVGVTFHVRGMGSTSSEFDLNRFDARGNFIYLRGDLSHQHDLPAGFQVFAKVQGQVSDQPLVNSEQFAGGGLSSVRGYLEAEVLGDDGVTGTVELRSPSLLNALGAEANDWRFYLFVDGGYLTLIDSLPEQDSTFALASLGVGSRIRFHNHFNGSLDAAVPLISQVDTAALDLRLTFRVWADF